MALTNFTLPFGVGLPINNWSSPTLPPIQQPHQATAVNNLLYGPDSDDGQYYKNLPYAPPAQPAVSYQQQRQQYHQQHLQRQNHYYQYRSRNNYLPPSPPKLASPSLLPAMQQHQPPNSQSIDFQSQTITNFEQNVRTYQQQQQQQQQQSQNGYPINENISDTHINSNSESTDDINSQSIANRVKTDDTYAENGRDHSLQPPLSDTNQPTFTRVNAGHGSKTQVHAVLDYDNDEQFDEKEITDQNDSAVTPIQGPIFIKNGSVPVVPLFSHPTLSNGTFVQIPIWWTALSVALGLEIRGEVIKGTPCVKRFNQLYCPSAGNSYPIDRIEEFIDENKALMRRMYGDFQTSNFNRPPEPEQPQQESSKRKRQSPGVPDITAPYGDSYFGKWRNKRQSNSDRPAVNPPTEPKSNRLDVCETRIEIVTPYWASNSAGKIRAIVNTQHFEQAIHQELCTKNKTSRCGSDCGCEQKYKWHRLLAYDPDDNCKGIFMDWFLFPSCCVCRCDPN